MLDAHTEAGFIVGTPFAYDGVYNFGEHNVTRRVGDLGAVMLRHRLTPPPEDSYSLHRSQISNYWGGNIFGVTSTHCKSASRVALLLPSYAALPL